MSRDRIAAVLRRHTERLMSLPGVVGIAEGECGGRPCVLVLVARKTPELERVIPGELEGVTVELRETGVIRASGLR